MCQITHLWGPHPGPQGRRIGRVIPMASAISNISMMLTFHCWLWRKEEICGFGEL